MPADIVGVRGVDLRQRNDEYRLVGEVDSPTGHELAIPLPALPARAGRLAGAIAQFRRTG
jgi:hypothetical protein